MLRWEFKKVSRFLLYVFAEKQSDTLCVILCSKHIIYLVLSNGTMVKVDECVSKSSKLNFEISIFLPHTC